MYRKYVCHLYVESRLCTRIEVVELINVEVRFGIVNIDYFKKD